MEITVTKFANNENWVAGIFDNVQFIKKYATTEDIAPKNKIEMMNCPFKNGAK